MANYVTHVPQFFKHKLKIQNSSNDPTMPIKDPVHYIMHIPSENVFFFSPGWLAVSINETTKTNKQVNQNVNEGIIEDQTIACPKELSNSSYYTYNGASFFDV